MWTVAQRIRFARTRAGVSVRVLAHEIDRDVHLLRDIERGRNWPTSGVLHQIAIVCGVSYEWLKGED